MLPTLISDVRSRFDELGSSGLMDPSEDVYKIVYLLTMRALGAIEVANSRPLLDKTLRLFELIAESSTSYQIIFPLVAVSSVVQALYGWHPNVHDLPRDRKQTKTTGTERR